MKKYWYFVIQFSTETNKNQLISGKLETKDVDLFPIVLAIKEAKIVLDTMGMIGSPEINTYFAVINQVEISEDDFKNNEHGKRFVLFL